MFPFFLSASFFLMNTLQIFFLFFDTTFLLEYYVTLHLSIFLDMKDIVCAKDPNIKTKGHLYYPLFFLVK